MEFVVNRTTRKEKRKNQININYDQNSMTIFKKTNQTRVR